MGKKGLQKKGPTNWDLSSVTLREESLGKKHINVSAKSMLKLQHIKNIAKWASVDASLPSLGAFFGHRLADAGEALGTPADPSLFTCQRCESILQPGSNCSVRIENNVAKAQCKRKKSKALLQNNVVYKCNFCSHHNLIRGTPKGHMKELYPPKDKAVLKSKSANRTLTKVTISRRAATQNAECNEKHEAVAGKAPMDTAVVVVSDVVKDDTENPETPSLKAGMTLLEARSKKRNKSKSKKTADSESKSAVVEAEKTVSTSNKRRRKSWTTLKELAESSDHATCRNLTNLSIPFFFE